VLATIEIKLYASGTFMLLNAENWKENLRVFGSHNIHTNVRENLLRKSNLSLETSVRPPRQRGDLESLLIFV